MLPRFVLTEAESGPVSYRGDCALDLISRYLLWKTAFYLLASGGLDQVLLYDAQ